MHTNGKLGFSRTRIAAAGLLALVLALGAAAPAAFAAPAPSLPSNVSSSAPAAHADEPAASVAKGEAQLAWVIAQRTDKQLAIDPAALEAIGTQKDTGHGICCPSFACAYADAIIDGTVHDHSYYTCCQCTWTDWGGGGSFNRTAESPEALLREAYDQIAQGKPTVVHVSASYGWHWVTLIGYTQANDPDNLTLANFIALDPWDDSIVNAAEAFSLAGDLCQHISTR